MAGLRQGPMLRDEICQHKAVAINKHQITPLAPPDCQIADARHADP
jgi:hypothetical protein